VSVNSTRLATIEILRAQIALGSDAAGFRGYSGFEHQANISPAVDAADQIERWLQARHGHARPALAREPTALALDTLLQRAAAYVSSYEAQFATVIGEEQYRQHYTEQRSNDAESFSARSVTAIRTLRSELSLSWFPDLPGWFGLRDVIDVDGKPVTDRDRRLASLFLEKPNGKLLKRALAESSRYNLGTIKRNFNVPMVALQFLESGVASRFQFEETDREWLDDVPVRVVRYQEHGHPTLILLNGEQDALAHGRFWIEPDTGRVLKTELVIGNADSDIRISTWYAPDARLDMLVPVRMTESYDHMKRVYDAIECDATYTNFRRFETGARILTPR